MADLRFLYAEQTDAARVALIRGDRAAAAAAFRSAIEMARGESSLDPQVVTALVHLGKIEQELGRPAEAERLFDEALTMGERCFGSEHPSLGAVLNELSRLHIRQSQHARAEVVLERLLRITRAKGEYHPDVATALAGLALVKRALGDHAAAEQRFREALRIRERALAPENMATVVTMEQLSETCAARGNLTEALTLLQRALTRREAALGGDHATVNTLRSRIAALDLRLLETATPTAEEEMTSWAESAASASVAVPIAPRVSAAPSVSIAPTLPTDSYEIPRVSAEVLTQSVETDAPLVTTYAPEAASLAPLSLEPAPRPRRKRVAMYASIGVAAVTLATVGLGARSRASAASDDDARHVGANAHLVADTMTRTGNGATTRGVATMEAVIPTASRAASDTSAGVMQAGAPMPAPALPAPSKLPVVPKNLATITARLIDKSNVDSLVRASTKLDRAIAGDQIGSGTGVATSSPLEDAGARPAALIAPAPLPHFPDELRGKWNESEVVVRFRVDERGHVDVSSMKVLKTDHELFTAAVRNVLPRFRFEPARSAAPQSKPIADWVDFRVRFTAAQ